MRKWRVGTLSMGIVMVALGLFLIFAQINKSTALSTVVKWWPMVLILLGGEVLWYSYCAKEENPKVKYDLFSIFIIFAIIVCSLGIFGLTEIGLVPQLQKMISAQEFVLQMPNQNISLEDNIKKVVVESNEIPLVVRTAQGNSMSVKGLARVTANTREAAEGFLQGNQVVSHRSGNTLYLSFNSSHGGSNLGYQVQITNYTLLIPEGRKVEINNGYSLRVYGDNIQNDWLIDGPGSTEIRLPQNTNIKINVSYDQPLDLSGNVKWALTGNKESGQGPFTGTLKFGEGKHKMNLIGGSSVTVYQLN